VVFSCRVLSLKITPIMTSVPTSVHSSTPTLVFHKETQTEILDDTV
jgi:hypothetical protein